MIDIRKFVVGGHLQRSCGGVADVRSAVADGGAEITNWRLRRVLAQQTGRQFQPIILAGASGVERRCADVDKFGGAHDSFAFELRRNLAGHYRNALR